MKWFEKFTLTVSYTTCIPLRKITTDQNQLIGLAPYLAPVGFFIGLLLVLEYKILSLIQANEILSSVMLVTSWFLVTGGLHFDGLMDTADGIFSHRSPERMIEIMSDSRTGNFGAIIGMVVLLMKIACLVALSSSAIFLVLFLVPGWARWCTTFAVAAFPYAKESGKGKIWHDSTSFPNDVLFASVTPLIITLLIAAYGNIPWTAVSIVTIGTILSGTLCSFWLFSVLKGQTGDTYGCIVEISEVMALMISALTLHLLF